jgi:hypothetical protein
MRQIETEFFNGMRSALSHYGFMKSAADEARLKITRPRSGLFHGFSRLMRKTGGNEPVDTLVQQMNEIDLDPQKPAVDGTTNKLDRSTAWGGPTNLAGGDAGSRTNSMGQPTASGAVF